MDDLMWRESPYGEVYAALSASLDPSMRNVVPGTGGAIGRSFDLLRAAGETAALKRLEAISLTIVALQQALRTGIAEAHAAARIELAQLTEEWLAAAPMFPPSCEARGEGVALQ
jgi:hypothetical protein